MLPGTNQDIRMQKKITNGVHHVGLTVPDLKDATDFFVEHLGFDVIGEKPAYPACFLHDGRVMLTLWQVREDAPVQGFDRFHHLGLHHLAFAVAERSDLDEIYRRMAQLPEVEIEFAPEPLGAGPATHMMLAGPGGIRLEFIHIPSP